jgi:HAD superfamily hydrolase (TIGR01459 family)
MTTFSNAPLRTILNHYQAFLVDVYGVLRHGSGVHKKAVPILHFMQNFSKRVIFFSNTSDHLPAAVCQRLRDGGFPAEEDQVVTSGMALRAALAQLNLVNKPVISVGNEATDEYVRQAGGVLSRDVEEAEASVLGFFVNTQNKAAFNLAIELAARRGKSALLLNTDRHIPINERELGYGPGVIGDIFAQRSGRAPIEVGKPAPYMYRLAYEKLRGIPKESILAIDDSLDYGILGANRERIDSLLVLSGLQGMITPHSKLDKHMRERSLYPTYIHAALDFGVDP